MEGKIYLKISVPARKMWISVSLGRAVAMLLFESRQNVEPLSVFIVFSSQRMADEGEDGPLSEQTAVAYTNLVVP